MILAAVNGGAAGAGGDSGFAQDRDGVALLQGPLKGAQLAVELLEDVQLGDHQGVVALAEAMQVEHQSAEVAVGELARLS